MTTHLTARITWHDSGNNGAVCRNPQQNLACRGHDWVAKWFADPANLERQVAAAGTPFSQLPGWRPPCWRDTGAFSSSGFNAQHTDPIDSRALPSVEEYIPPFSLCPTPYRWMLEEQFDDICREENLAIRSRRDLARHPTWVMEDDRQRSLLEHFWNKVKPRKSLIFFYYNQENEIDDSSLRLIAGVAEVDKVADPIYFGRSANLPGRFPVWSRCVTHGWPDRGVRIPYLEYIAAGADPSSIACRPPKGSRLPFNYVAEHLSEGQAVSVLSEVIRVIEKVKGDAIASGDWASSLRWLDQALDSCWTGRGAYPSIGPLLRWLGCPRGTAFQRQVLAPREAAGEDPWLYTKMILEGAVSAPSPFTEDFAQAAAKWRQVTLKRKLIEVVVRLELDLGQLEGILEEEERIKRGVAASSDSICNNPYLISEQDRGSSRSEPVELSTVDQAEILEGSAANFRTKQQLAFDHPHRVRATGVAVLREAAENGDTVLPLSELLTRIRGWHPERRKCSVSEEQFWANENREFYGQILWFHELEAAGHKDAEKSGGEPADEFAEDLGQDEESKSTLRLVGLKRIRRDEDSIAKIVRSATSLTDAKANQPSWASLLCDPQAGGFEEPQSERARVALAEKEAALRVLWNERISVLTGGAGSGKTSVLRLFVRQLFEVEGPRTLLLAAPTGKARVRLESATGRKAKTVHQVLNDAGLLGPNYRLLDTPTKGRLTFDTVIIDESSMCSVELLGCLFRAVNASAARRIIFVGDPYQLPPIGAGRPFFDIIQYLREERPQALAELATSMRKTSKEDSTAAHGSVGLALAQGFRGEKTRGDDELLSELARKGTVGDTTLRVWNSPDQLPRLLTESLKLDCEVETRGPAGLDRLIGYTPKEPKAVEAWQILTPTRISASGTDALNRFVQDRFRSSRLDQASDPRARWPRPFGAYGTVHSDKVMQRVNTPKWLPKDAKGLRFVANGEIGVVYEAWKGREGKEDVMKVTFSTQPEASYSYPRSDADELELAYALTVHKAQGSDFGTTVLVIPESAGTLSRELIYTGLTRFSGRLVLLVQNDLGSLLKHRRKNSSDTLKRTTMMFEFGPGVPSVDGPDQLASYRPEGLIHRTRSGVPVRSKSEIIVADMLTELGLEWTYEEPLVARTGDTKDFRIPDFTIRHAGRIFYWEHLGMLHVKAYREGWERKRLWYETNGYWQSVITSDDDPERGFRGDEIERLARDRILAG